MLLLWGSASRNLFKPKDNVQIIVYLHDPHQAKKNISQRFIEDTKLQS